MNNLKAEQPSSETKQGVTDLTEDAESCSSSMVSRAPGGEILGWIGSRFYLLQIGVWGIVVVTVGAGFILWRLGYLEPRDLGLGGVFLSNLIGSATIFLPLPGLTFACAASAPTLELSLPLVALLGATGSAIGEITAYMIGFGIAQSGGENLMRRYKGYERISGLMRRRGGYILFFFSATPNPFFDAAGVAAGSLRYRLWEFLVWVLIGKLVKYGYTVVACSAGISWLQRLIGTS